MPFRKANFIIKQNEVSYKIFKIILDKNGDLYFIFNYCRTNEYKSGNAIIKAGQNELTFTPTIDGRISKIPLKLSYHSDGQIHFKPMENSDTDLPKGYKLAEMKTTAFEKLNNNHFLTIELEALNNFETVSIKRSNEYNRIFEVPAESVRYKFIFSGCLNPEETIKIHHPVDILSISRKTKPNIFNVAIQIQIFNDSIKVNTEKDKLMFIVICGFRSDDNVLEKDMELLFLQAE